MCEFNYEEYSPCNCRLFYPNLGYKLCPTEIAARGATTSNFMPVVIVPSATEDLDFCDGYTSFRSASKAGKNIITSRRCKEQTYIENGRKESGCPWHVGEMERRKRRERYNDGKEERRLDFSKRHDEMLNKMKDQQLERQSDKCILQ